MESCDHSWLLRRDFRFDATASGRIAPNREDFYHGFQEFGILHFSFCILHSLRAITPFPRVSRTGPSAAAGRAFSAFPVRDGGRGGGLCLRGGGGGGAASDTV